MFSSIDSKKDQCSSNDPKEENCVNITCAAEDVMKLRRTIHVAKNVIGEDHFYDETV